MTATPPRYRTLDRPGPGLALIAEPDGRVMLWALTLRGTKRYACSQCGVVSGWHYHPSLKRGKGGPRLCCPCVEGTPEPRGATQH